MQDILNYLPQRSKEINRELLKFFPKRVTRRWLNNTLGKPKYTYDISTVQKEVANPIWDFLDRGGKRWRPALMILCCEAVGGSTKLVKKLSVIPELAHTGSIVIDDIEDDSVLRRGKPCTHKLFGLDTAINDGNLMYFLPLILIYKNSKLNNQQKSRLFEVYAEEMLRLSFGQAMDIHWHKGKRRNITEKQYLQMCECKTGALARMAAKMGAILGSATPKQVEALGNFAASIGAAFQIQDDILNITPNKGWGKEVGDDISEGKHTLLVIRTLQKANKKDASTLVKTLNKKTKNKAQVRKAISIIKRYDALDYATKKARSIVIKSWDELSPTLKKGKSKLLLKSFADYLIERKI